MNKIKIKNLIVFLILFAIGLTAFLVVHKKESPSELSGDFVEYEKLKVIEIVSDTCTPDAVSEGCDRGTQNIVAEVLSGRYKGDRLLVSNAVGPVYGQRLNQGNKFIGAISTYANGDVRATVYEYDRSFAIFAMIIFFFLITLLVGRKTGLRSLVSLVFTIFALLFVLIPLILKGAPVIITTLITCAWITCISFLIIGGINEKTICASLGTIAGFSVSTLIAFIFQKLMRITGYRQEYAEALLQLRQTGESPISIKNLLIAGVIISSLGAVMDVAMSISSSVTELRAAFGTQSTQKKLFTSAMNIGRDMVGTMTNTLILATLGSGFTLIIYISSLGLPLRQFCSSAYFAIETLTGLASSFGVILAVPFTAFISSFYKTNK